MKLGFTINIGDYNGLRIESNDHTTIENCLVEIYLSLMKLAPTDDMIRYFLNREYFDIAREIIKVSK